MNHNLELLNVLLTIILLGIMRNLKLFVINGLIFRNSDMVYQF
jgi:hypothetical protein